MLDSTYYRVTSFLITKETHQICTFTKYDTVRKLVNNYKLFRICFIVLIGIGKGIIVNDPRTHQAFKRKAFQLHYGFQLNFK